MIKNSNVHSTAITVFDIFQKLFSNDIKKEDLFSKFSDDNLYFYINTLKKIGFDILMPKKAKGYYSLRNNINFLNLNNNDIEILASIKKILTLKYSYQDIILYNDFLTPLYKYTNANYKEKINNIISDKPFGADLHNKLLTLQKFIDEKTPVIITYISPNSDKNFYKVFPKCLKIKNKKPYFFCFDNSISDTRYLRVERIEAIKPIDEIYKIDNQISCAICEFSLDINLSDTEDVEITEKNNDFQKVKIYYENSFDFIQKILSYGDKCKVIEPIEIKNKIIQKLDETGKLYAGKN